MPKLIKFVPDFNLKTCYQMLVCKYLGCKDDKSKLSSNCLPMHNLFSSPWTNLRCLWLVLH